MLFRTSWRHRQRQHPVQVAGAQATLVRIERDYVETPNSGSTALRGSAASWTIRPWGDRLPARRRAVLSFHSPSDPSRSRDAGFEFRDNHYLPWVVQSRPVLPGDPLGVQEVVAPVVFPELLRRCVGVVSVPTRPRGSSLSAIVRSPSRRLTTIELSITGFLTARGIAHFRDAGRLSCGNSGT